MKKTTNPLMNRLETLRLLGAAGATAFVGWDQANILIPRSLAGRRNVDLVMIVDGKNSNTVSINIK